MRLAPFIQSVHSCAVPLLFAVSFSIVGCSAEREFDRPATFPVVGKVTLNGEVVPQGQRIMIEAIREGAAVDTADDGLYESSGSAIAQEDGSFEMGTFKTGDGLEPGKYKLVFKVGILNLIQARYSGDRLNGKYLDPAKSEHSVEVTGNETEPIVLDDINLTE